MKFRTCLYCVVFNCAVILPYLTAKPVSLNKLIEEEEKSIQSRRQDLKPSIKPETDEKSRILDNEYLASRLNKLTRTGSIFSQVKKISPLQYRKTFLIKSPLKPRRIKLFQRRNIFKNPTIKRETYQYDTINEKYIPLLRNLGLLFDNILSPDSSETSFETREKYRNTSDESDEVVCTCASRKGIIRRTNETRQKTAASTRIVTIEITTEIATTSTINSTNDNISSVRWNKNVPLLLTGNTTSIRRNNIRFDERSSTPHFRSVERHIPGNCGNHECNTGDGKIQSYTEDNEENSDGATRNYASSDGSIVGRGGNRDNSRRVIGNSKISPKFETTANKTAQGFRRHIPEHERKIQFEVRRDETESSSVLSEPNTRLREFVSYEETKPLQTTEAYEEDTINEPYSNTAVQQFLERNGKDTSEDQKLCGTNEAVISGNIAVNTSSPVEKFVMIFDGYSVARDVNGKNTLTEKAITIHY